MNPTPWAAAVTELLTPGAAASLGHRLVYSLFILLCACSCTDDLNTEPDLLDHPLPVGTDPWGAPDALTQLDDLWATGPDLGGWRPTEADLRTSDSVSKDWGSSEGFEPWSLVVLPDTQYYSERYPHVFDAQTKWISANARTWNIRFVIHVGDITNRNTADEYEVAVRAMKRLRQAGIPFALVPGNHDYEGNSGKRESLLPLFFSEDDYAYSSRVGTFESGNIENSWHIFEAGGQSWLVLALEFGPRKEVVEWASAVAARYRDSRTILVTHAYMYEDNTRYDWDKKGEWQYWNPHTYPIAQLPGGVSDGQELWDRLVSRIPGAAFVLSGHVLGDGLGRLSSLGLSGNVVHQMLANYQTGCTSDLPEGGAGYLRILWHGAPDEVDVLTFSPYMDKYLTDEQNEFSLTFRPKDYL